MRSLILGALGSLILLGTASLALHIDASIAEDEYVRPEAPSVTLDESYEDGIYSFEGTLRVPTRCTDVIATPVVSENVVRIDVVTTEDEGPCLMLETNKKFTGTLEVPGEIFGAVYVNGVKAVVVETL